MAARWFLSYKLHKYESGDRNRVDKDIWDIDKVDEGFFAVMHNSFSLPDRAFKSVGTWYGEDKSRKKEDRTLDYVLERASGTYNEQTGRWRPTGELVLKAAALVVVGETKEIVKLVKEFPNGVGTIRLPPAAERDFFQIGYARVGMSNNRKKKETVVIVAPQVSWWDGGPQGRNIIIHHPDKDKGWKAFTYADSLEKPTKWFPMENLAKWLPQADKRDPWVFVDEKKYWT
jgi:hypothetical protein